MNWFDLVLILVVTSSTIAGLRTGFARVVVGLIAIVGGFLAAIWMYRLAAFQITRWVSSVAAANIIGFLAILVGVLIVGSLVAAILSKLFAWVGLGWFNHLLGGFIGALRGALLVAMLVAAFVAFAPSPPPEFLNESRVLPYATRVATMLADLAPREMKDAFTQQMDTIREFWNDQQRLLQQGAHPNNQTPKKSKSNAKEQAIAADF